MEGNYFFTVHIAYIVDRTSTHTQKKDNDMFTYKLHNICTKQDGARQYMSYLTDLRV